MVCKASNPSSPPLHQRNADGFSYVELLVAIAVTSIGISAVMAGLQTGLCSSHTASTMELAREFADSIRQFSNNLAFKDPQGGASFGSEEIGYLNFDDLDDLNGFVQSPPIQGDGTVMTAFPSWCQKVTVKSFDGATLNSAADGSTSIVQITVRIERDGCLAGVYRWLVREQ